VNGDGTVTLADVILLNRAIIGDVMLNDEAITAADVNSDGYVDENDALVLLKFTIQLIDIILYTE